MSAFLVLKQQALSFSLFFLGHFSKASPLFRVIPAPTPSHGLAFWTCSNVFHLDSTLAASRGSAFGLACFFEWTRRLRRLVARPSAPLLLRMTPVPAESYGLAFGTCSNVFHLDSMLNCSVSWLGLWPRLFFEWTRRLRRLVARPSASLLLRMTPAPAVCHGLAFWTC